MAQLDPRKELTVMPSHEGLPPPHALPEPAEWYRLFVGEVQDYAMFTLDRDGRVSSWNVGAERLLGWTAAEILGQPGARVFVPEDVAQGAPEHELATAARDGRAEDERWYVRKDGGRFWGSGVMTALRSEAGALLGFGKILRDRTERRRLEERLRAALHEKDVLLKEIHHRVKNHLQVLSSLLSIRSSALEDATTLAVFHDCQARIQSMALVHDVLCESNSPAGLNLGDYIRRLAVDVFRAHTIEPGRIHMTVDAEEAWLSAEKAVPCGLILNELLSNSVKHAFPEGRSGDIHVVLRRDGEAQLTLAVGDSGVGVPEDLDVRHTDSLGLQLVCLLTEQLGGSIALERRHGSTFVLRFPA
jgi:PAS domain S-box-containing protein